MSTPPSPRGPIAGGAILAITMTTGTAVGVALRQPSLGFLAGLAIGAAISVVIWLRDRR